LKKNLLPYLVCPSCEAPLDLSVTKTEDGEILEGELRCTSCLSSFSITAGIPRFANLEQVESDKRATAAGFGWQWQHFTQEDERYAEQFLGWIAPVTPEFFRDKVVLEGGCGKGRHTQLAARWGACDVIGIDLSVAVETAFAATRSLPNAHIIQADIYHLPLARKFDYAFSVGVLHHLPDPRARISSLGVEGEAGGHVSAWIYGAENNEWITRFVNPVREKITSRMDQRSCCNFEATGACVYARDEARLWTTKPQRLVAREASFLQRLPERDLKLRLARAAHDRVRSPRGAHGLLHLAREFETWWRDIDARDVEISWHNKNSWAWSWNE
jgi:SAM-dependent methyltransferase